MNKSDLITAVAESTGLTKILSGAVIDAFLLTVTETLKKGEDVALPGFGTFSAESRAARVGRNPRTGEATQIPAKIQPKFKAGKRLKDAVQ